MSVAIVLATFQGGAHLRAFLDSLQEQTFRDWTLWARDDGSTDETCAILEEHVRRSPERFRILDRPAGRLGAKDSFGVLLQACPADVLFLADQDDVWLPDKMARSLDALRALEAEHGRDTPLLVHTDLRPVDAGLRPLADSFWRHGRLDPDRPLRPGGLLVRNVVTGCATAVNRALCDVALPLPPDAFMHDWWLALVAAAFGHVRALPGPAVLYRQHDTNTVGMRPPGLWRIPPRARVRRYYARTRAQACAFRERFGERLPPAVRSAVDAYCALDRMGAWSRRAALLRGGFLDDGLLRNLAMFLAA